MKTPNWHENPAFVSFFERLCRLSHGLQDGCVCVGPLQGLPLLLHRRQGTVDLCQLGLVALLSLDGLWGGPNENLNLLSFECFKCKGWGNLFSKP